MRRSPHKVTGLRPEVAAPGIDLDERDPSWATDDSIVDAERQLAIAVLALAIKDAFVSGKHYATCEDRDAAYHFLFNPLHTDDLKFWLNNALLDTTPEDFRLLLRRKYGDHRPKQVIASSVTKSHAAEAKAIRELLSTGPATCREIAEASDLPTDTVAYVIESLYLLGRVQKARSSHYRLAPSTATANVG
jgi:hypothetical protein